MKNFLLKPWCSYLILAGIALAKPVHSRAADPFTKITGDPVVSSSGTSAAWGDFNNDGFIDLYVNVLNSGPSLLYSNNGNGTFSRVLIGSIVTDAGSCFGAAWADYDNDGFLDLFVAVNNSGNDWLYHNNGNGTFTKITSGAIVSSGGNGNNCSWGDYDNDGFVDLFVANSDQNDFLYHNNGDGTFTRVTAGAIAARAGNSQGGSWGDYDNDGLLDLFVSRVNEPNLLYHNEGNGVFRSVTNGAIVTETDIGQGTSWGDYDNDGFLDLFVGNPNARNFLYRNNGDGTFTKITNSVVAADTGGTGCGWADYDNDGYLDLFVATRSGHNVLYHNNGDGSFSRVTNSIASTDPSASFTVAWGDFDNDGFPDLFVSNPQAYRNALYRNNGNSNSWITIKCEGRMSNGAGIGAKVRVKATIASQTRWQLREISGGGGLGSQNDLRAQFGLGDATQVDLVRIEWPSHFVQELTNLAVKQFLTIIEPGLFIAPKSQDVTADSSVTLTLNSTLPSSFSYQWRLNGMALEGETNALLLITNVQVSDIGAYTVAANDSASGASFISGPAVLSGPISLTLQPQGRSARIGTNVTFTVNAMGSGLTYQWQRDGTNVAAATNASLTLTNIQVVNEGDYSAIVSNSFSSVTSATARLVVLMNPVLTQTLPAQITAVAGQTVTYQISLIGHPPPFNYQLRRGSSLVTNLWLMDSNCVFTVENVQTNQAGLYRFVVTNLATLGTPANSASTLIVLADSDGDHMPDSWEIRFGLDPNDASDAIGDLDGDGMTNLQEYLAGTDPTNSVSYLKLDFLALDRATDSMSLSFTAVSNKTYSVEFRSPLESSAWTPLAKVSFAPTNRLVQIVDPAPVQNNTTRFYRLAVREAFVRWP